MFCSLIKRVVGARYSVYAWLASGSAIVLVALMLLTVADVIGRYVFNQPIKGTTEISMQMMAYVIFFGLAYTLVKGSHVRVGFLLERFPQRLRILAEVITDIVGLGLCGLLMWGSSVQFWDSWAVSELMPAAIDIPWWPAKLAMPVGLFLIAFQFLAYLFSHIIELAKLSKD